MSEHTFAVAYPTYIREKARQMRVERHFTIDEIAERLALPRTTIYYWVRDLPIERNRARQSKAQRLGTAANVERCRRLRENAYRQGREEFAELAADPTFRDFVCMYVGEGFKRDRNSVSLCNSDPIVVSLAARWIRKFASNPVDYALQYHADQDPERLRQFWALRLGTETEKIRLQRKSNSNQLKGRTWRSKHGVLNVRCRDIRLRARVQGWIDETKASWVTG